MAEKQAEKKSAEPVELLPPITEADKSRARQWFKKAADCRERREYDYAIECFITALSFWPEAVDEGHKVLRSVAIQRQQAGGKKPSMMEGMKKPMTGKDVKAAMLNAEFLLSKDPASDAYLDGFLKNAARGGFFETLQWLSPLVFDSMRKEKKPNASRFKTFRQALTEAAEKCASKPNLAAHFYEQALSAVEYLMVRSPGDMALKDEQRDLSGRLTICKGKYAEGDSFRESLRDAEGQKILHDSERTMQADETHGNVIDAAREWEANPTIVSKLVNYIDLLLKREDKAEEDRAIALLEQVYGQTSNYSLKVRADDVRMRRRRREVRALQERARESGAADDAQQARLALLDALETEADVYRERATNYPTELRIKFRLGETLFHLKHFDEAIPVLQEASIDPRSRTRAQLIMGRCFYEQDAAATAAEILSDAANSHDIPGDDLHKELLYWLGRAQQAAGQIDEAQQTLGKLLRMDYNYAQGDARKRASEMKK